MTLRSQHSVWWPNLSKDIERVRASCLTCHKNAPSQQPLPPVNPPMPEHPFQLVSSDYFQLEGHVYLVLVDRYSNWPIVKKCKSETAEDLVESLREYFSNYGVPKEITTDGGMAYVADSTQRFLKTWGVAHRVSTAYNPHSNLRAETAVKSIKRLISNNTGRSGSLNTDALAAALLTYRNTPDRDTGMSPAQILFARQLSDTVPQDPAKLKLRPEWVLTAEAREKALSKRHLARHTDLLNKSKTLKPLQLHDIVQVQNQRGSHSNKWDLSGTIVEVLNFDAYVVKMDGSGRVTKRNRQFLRPIIPFNQAQAQPNNFNTGSSADSREATTTAQSSHDRDHQADTKDKSAPVILEEPDCLPQSKPMSDQDFNDGLLRAANNVRNIPHQNRGNRPEPAQKITKRVRISPKRYIAEY